MAQYLRIALQSTLAPRMPPALDDNRNDIVHAVSRIAEAPDRERVRLRGSIHTVTLRPRGGVPALEAELDDGSQVLTVIWLGRRQIAGIEPGRTMQIEGRIGVHHGHRVMFNPRYELLP